MIHYYAGLDSAISNIPIYGYIYDVKSGKLVEVPEATTAGKLNWPEPILVAPRRSGADHQHYDANDRQAAASRPVSSEGRTEERDWWRSARQYPARQSGEH